MTKECKKQLNIDLWIIGVISFLVLVIYIIFGSSINGIPSNTCRMALIDSSMFGIPFKGYDYYQNGIKYPAKFQAVWNYTDEDFIYFDGHICKISYEDRQ